MIQCVKETGFQSLQSHLRIVTNVRNSYLETVILVYCPLVIYGKKHTRIAAYPNGLPSFFEVPALYSRGSGRLDNFPGKTGQVPKGKAS